MPAPWPAGRAAWNAGRLPPVMTRAADGMPRSAARLIEEIEMQRLATMKRLLLAAMLLPLLGLAACNTFEGAGQDLQSAGRAVEDTARDAK